MYIYIYIWWLKLAHAVFKLLRHTTARWPRWLRIKPSKIYIYIESKIFCKLTSGPCIKFIMATITFVCVLLYIEILCFRIKLWWFKIHIRVRDGESLDRFCLTHRGLVTNLWVSELGHHLLKLRFIDWSLPCRYQSNVSLLLIDHLEQISL